MAKRSCPWVAEANKRRKGRKHSAATKAKIAASVKQGWDASPDDTRRVDSEVRAKMQAGASKAGKGQRGVKRTAEACQSMSKAQKRYWASEDSKEARVALAERGRNMPDAQRSALAEGAHRTWKDRPKSQEHRERISAGVAKAYVEDRFHPEYWTKRGHHLSPKAGNVYYRSSYELKAYQLLDADPTVLTYTPEPFAIPYKDAQGQSRNYVPDILVSYIDGSTLLVEIKPQYQLDAPEVEYKHAVAQLHSQGWFAVWTEAELAI
jgi:hypothetical protein